MDKVFIVNVLVDCMPHTFDINGDVLFYSKDAEITVYDDYLRIEYTDHCFTTVDIEYRDIDKITWDNSAIRLAISAHPIKAREPLFQMFITVGIEQEEEDAED